MPEVFRSAGTAKLLSDVVGDSKLTSALIAITAKLSLQSSNLLEEPSQALAQLYLLLPEGASGDVPDTISEKRAQELRDAIERYQEDPSEVNETTPWITPVEKQRIEHEEYIRAGCVRF